MSHSFSTPALIFSIKPLGENNSSVCFFTETEGILYATMYGGHKSKLKSLVSPWNSGIAYFSKSTTTQFLRLSKTVQARISLLLTPTQSLSRKNIAIIIP